MFVGDRDRTLKMTAWGIHAVGAFVLLLGVGGYQFFVFSLLSKRHQQCQHEIVRTQQLLASQPRTERALAELDARLRELEQRAQRTKAGIPEEPGESEFLRQLTEVADEEQLKIRDFHTGLARQEAGYSQLDVRLLGEGPHDGICGFLERITQLPRVTTVQRMQITGTEGRAVYPLEVTLTLYFAAHPITAAPPPTR